MLISSVVHLITVYRSYSINLPLHCGNRMVLGTGLEKYPEDTDTLYGKSVVTSFFSCKVRVSHFFVSLNLYTAVSSI